MRRREGRVAGLAALGGALIGLAASGGTGGAGRAPVPWKNPPERLVLATGLPLVYQKDASSPTTVVGLVIGGGLSAVPAGLDGLAAVATRLLLEIPDEGKVQALMAQATRMSYACLEDCSMVLVECLSENLEDALRLAGKIVQDPLLSGLRVGRAKEMMATGAKAAQDDAVTAARAAAFSAFFGGAGYGSAPLGSEAGLEALDRKDVAGYVRRFVVRPNVSFCVQTDLELEPVRRLLERSFAAIPDGPAAELPRQDPVLPAGRDIQLERDTRQTCVARAFVLPRSGLGDMAMGDLLESVLGQGPGSRLWALRETDRLAYTVDAEVTWLKSCGVLMAHLETDRTKAAAAGEALDRTLSGLREDGLPEEEFEAARTMARARFLRLTEAKVPRLRTLVLFEGLGLGAEAAAGFYEALSAASLQEMNAYIRESLDPERSLRIMVGPSAAVPPKEE